MRLNLNQSASLGFTQCQWIESGAIGEEASLFLLVEGFTIQLYVEQDDSIVPPQDQPRISRRILTYSTPSFQNVVPNTFKPLFTYHSLVDTLASHQRTVPPISSLATRAASSSNRLPTPFPCASWSQANFLKRTGTCTSRSSSRCSSVFKDISDSAGAWVWPEWIMGPGMGLTPRSSSMRARAPSPTSPKGDTDFASLRVDPVYSIRGREIEPLGAWLVSWSSSRVTLMGCSLDLEEVSLSIDWTGDIGGSRSGVDGVGGSGHASRNKEMIAIGLSIPSFARLGASWEVDGGSITALSPVAIDAVEVPWGREASRSEVTMLWGGAWDWVGMRNAPRWMPWSSEGRRTWERGALGQRTRCRRGMVCEGVITRNERANEAEWLPRLFKPSEEESDTSNLSTSLWLVEGNLIA